MQERRRAAPKGGQVERVHERRTGNRVPYWVIALALYRETGSCYRVATRLLEIYRVRVDVKTASTWINRGLAEERAAELARDGIDYDPDPAEAAP